MLSHFSLSQFLLDRRLEYKSARHTERAVIKTLLASALIRDVQLKWRTLKHSYNTVLKSQSQDEFNNKLGSVSFY